ncbi:MAG: response regulator transcription factor [Dehalococcoidia bacterium]|nr:response regulator transcription factor [Dehalococcoidia bacterium]
MSLIEVVIVEDDAKFRGAFARLIEATVDMDLIGTAATLAQGFDLVRRGMPDVLLVDLDLPDGSGLDLIRHVAARSDTCDIMVITVFGDERHVLESIEAGASGYLLKDSMPADFIEQIRVLHAGGSPISPVIARQLLSRFVSPRAAMAAVGVPELSDRERAVLNLVTKGFSYQEIATLLRVSPHTVLTYVKRIYRKLQVGSKTEAVYEARKLGLLRD